MAMEVACGNCHGRLLVEQTGVVVACPHCGAHLQIGDPVAPQAPSSMNEAPPPDSSIPSATPPPPEPDLLPQFAPAEMAPLRFPSRQAANSKAQTSSDGLPEIILTPPADMHSSVASDSPPVPMLGTHQNASPVPENDSWMPKIDVAIPKAATVEPPPRLASLESSTLILPARHEAVSMLENSMLENAPPEVANPAAKGEPTDIWSRERLERELADQSTIGAEPEFITGLDTTGKSTVVDPLSATTMLLPQPPAEVLPDTVDLHANAELAEVEPPVSSLSIETPARSVPNSTGVPRFLFLVVASYASAVTLALLYLLYRGTSTLDLPDVVPQFNKNGKAAWRWVDEKPLPVAYRLKLGESKQYGNVKVTPLKVTQGPLQFVHFSDQKQQKTATAVSVLKLWVKFENVSNDQTFPALDEQLLYERANDKDNASQVKANNYVCQRSECKRLGKRVPVYALPINGEWMLKDQNLNSPIAPHQTWETYIPSNDEDLSSLQGPLTWRVHFRKGYNPQSFRGVTTLVEVEFNSQDIQAES